MYKTRSVRRLGLRRFSRYIKKQEDSWSTGPNLSTLNEVIQQQKFIDQLKNEACPKINNNKNLHYEELGISKEDYVQMLVAALATCALHVESRKASAIGEAFYTIGPCGEELLAPVGKLIRTTDAMALHYRHLAPSVCRQLSSGKPLEDVIMDRARGYVVSAQDPVTGGAHCALGGSKYDFVVTSTLASQAPPAVGRALGFYTSRILLSKAIDFPLNLRQNFPSNAISYVSVGDGSVNNAHFLSATNLAEYARARNFKCPIVFGISDNDRCISLPGYGWLEKFVTRFSFPVHFCDGLDILDVYQTLEKTVNHARSTKSPSMIIFSGVPRRFGHAATDRQSAYLTQEQLNFQTNHPVLAPAIRQAVENGVESYQFYHDYFLYIKEQCLQSFAAASEEEKLTSRENLMALNSPPLVHVDRRNIPDRVTKRKVLSKGDVMRKLMTEVMREILTEHTCAYYIGEDVLHGGYYLVTDGIAKEFPKQIQDFPPDETSIMGAAMGFSQCGLLPIVEIPYAKYLDCAADMYFEAIIQNWLTAGQRPNGMIIRLQGFGVGVFGGNYHTHNILHIPPGLDVVCYSNGADYVRGWRYLAQQAAAGRCVMSVDATHLLNERHLHDKDGGWLTKYPNLDEFLDFETVMRYDPPQGENPKTCIVSYGSGVIFSLRAVKKLREDHNFGNICVIDCPLLSDCPKMLKEEIQKFDSVIFADTCKKGNTPFSHHINILKDEDILPDRWNLVSSQKTYNPLGTTLTFLSPDDIVEAVLRTTKKSNNI